MTYTEARDKLAGIAKPKNSSYSLGYEEFFYRNGWAPDIKCRLWISVGEDMINRKSEIFRAETWEECFDLLDQWLKVYPPQENQCP